MRSIKLMADYHCHPLWEVSPGEVGNIDPEELPLSPALRKRLSDWASRFDATLNDDYPPDSGFKSQDDEFEFKEEGKALGALLQIELGPKYRVILKL